MAEADANEVAASAPGKLVLLGEYAVLDGAPALVSAIDARARVQVRRVAGSGCRLEAPDVLPLPLHFGRGADGSPDWPDDDSRQRLALVDQILRGLSARHAIPTGGLDLAMDTSAFYTGVGASRQKLGLGSSAALTVALASALAAAAGRLPADRGAWLADLLAMHRDFQGGRGSGADLAAAIYGGSLVYRLDAGSRPRVSVFDWPSPLNRLFVWSGRSASTGDFLARLAQWRQRRPRDYAAHFAELRTLAEAGAAAATEGAADALLAVCGGYAAALQKLGNAAKIDIYSASHRQIDALVTAMGGVYKPCGAGGGDLGVALTVDPEHTEAIRNGLAKAGFVCPRLAPEREGMELKMFGEGH